jgi:hypothetical protein
MARKRSFNFYFPKFGQYAHQNYLKAVAADALTFDGQSGGMRANWVHSSDARRAGENRLLQGLLTDLQHYKDGIDGNELQNVSHSDFLIMTAAFVMKDCDGPDLIKRLEFGRKDAQSDADSSSNVHSNDQEMQQRLSNCGFSEEEATALAYINAFGAVQDPAHSRHSTHPKFDNFFFKQLAKNQTHNLS